MNAENTLHIAEVPFESGSIRFRYARRLSADGTRWIRHGRFLAYHETGGVASEGDYVDGQEEGLWRDYYPNGQLAAEGRYSHGKEEGEWRYFSADGKEKSVTFYRDGVECAPQA